MELLIAALVIAVIIAFSKFIVKWIKRIRERGRDIFLNVLNEYGLDFPDTAMYFCKYVGGHPDRDSETRSGQHILFGVKSGKLIFFISGGLSFEGRLTCEKTFKKYFQGFEDLRYLFEIQNDSIVDIRYFDATTSSASALVGGDHWAIPIYTKKGDASVLIDWNDGRYNHSTEFRFTGFQQGHQANKRANTMRNTLIQMTK